MNSEENILKGFSDNKTKVPKTTVESEPVVVESEANLNEQIKNEEELLEGNLKGLQNDINEFGSEKELAESLEYNPGIARRIANRAFGILPVMALGASLFIDSIQQNAATNNYIGIAVNLFELAAATGLIAATIEGIKSFNKKAPAEKVVEEKTEDNEKTPNRLIKYGDLVIKNLCKDYKTDGMDQLKKFKEEHPDDKFVITGSHMNNLDVPAALTTLGGEGGFNLQVTGNELFMEKLKYIPQNIGVKTLFRDRFTSLGQKDEDKVEYENGKKVKKNIESGVFRPENFEEIDKQMENGRTPWMAAHSFSLDGKMRKVDNGAVIQAYRQNAWILPTALELTAGSKNMQGVKEMAKNLKESSATYHLGQPYKPDPLPEGMDINILLEVVNKRKAGEEISDQEFEAFKKVNRFLSEQTEKLGKVISEMLPEEQRGFYQKK